MSNYLLFTYICLILTVISYKKADNTTLFLNGECNFLIEDAILITYIYRLWTHRAIFIWKFSIVLISIHRPLWIHSNWSSSKDVVIVVFSVDKMLTFSRYYENHILWYYRVYTIWILGIFMVTWSYYMAYLYITQYNHFRLLESHLIFFSKDNILFKDNIWSTNRTVYYMYSVRSVLWF